ncbi:kinase-like domain-containing protein [Limtongia smithiae]|uniref:kinase-like domain-containing protein n=1 Tax=Limtongia smithiae TaxID=1125753 RepID=UPI0034D0227B
MTDSIHNYYDIKFHASGAFSNVYRCHARSNSPAVKAMVAGSEVALKISTPATQRAPHSPSRERRLLEILRHDNVVHLLSSFEDEADLVLVLPFLPLQLRALNVTEDGLKWSVAREITSAIAFLHQQCIIHRDIKPSNILLASPRGPAYLTDFGTAWVPSSFLPPEAGSVTPEDEIFEPAGAKVTEVGTSVYRAPELLFGYKCYDSSIDLWSWGCVLAELWHGTPIFQDGYDADFSAGDMLLANAIFRVLGTPDVASWPQAMKFPSFASIKFIQYPPVPLSEILLEVPPEVIQITENLLRYESEQRLAADKLLSMPGLAYIPSTS